MSTDNPFSHSLAYLAILAKKERDTRLLLHATMTELREHGCPLREIAAAAKVSHETVRRITSA